MSWPALIADIGGTNARFAIIRAPGAQPSHNRNLLNADYASLADAIRAYCQLENITPKRAAIAAAGPQQNGIFKLTNLSQWDVPIADLTRELGFSDIRILNDFEALALSLPHLGPDDLFSLKPNTKPHENSALAVIGPGTGLGVGAVLKTATGWQAIPSEGGHVELGNRHKHLAQYLDQVRDRFGRVSAERILCGKGFALLHEIMSGESLDPAELGAKAVNKDAKAHKTAQAFLSLLASLAGDMALVYGARGGVFIGGGIITKLVPLIDAENFAADFRAKGRLEPYLDAIPVHIITNPVPALIGCAASLE